MAKIRLKEMDVSHPDLACLAYNPDGTGCGEAEIDLGAISDSEVPLQIEFQATRDNQEIDRSASSENPTLEVPSPPIKLPWIADPPPGRGELVSLGVKFRLSGDSAEASWLLAPNTSGTGTGIRFKGHKSVRPETDTDLFIRDGSAAIGWKSPDISIRNMDDRLIEHPPMDEPFQIWALVHNQDSGSPVGKYEFGVDFYYAVWFMGMNDPSLIKINESLCRMNDRKELGAGSYANVKCPCTLNSKADRGDNGIPWSVDPKITVGDSVHVCIKARIVYPYDSNNSNNDAQSNFFDVPTTKTESVARFLVGNPLKHEVDAQLNLSDLYSGFEARLSDFPVTDFQKKFTLKPEEVRVATVTFVPPPNILQNLPDEDVIANISLSIFAEEVREVGGISFRLVKGRSTTPA